MVLDLEKIKRVKTLAQYIGLYESLIKELANDPSKREISLIKINQRNKERRVVKVKSNTYKYILKVLALYLNEQYKTPDCVYGYVKGKSILENSKLVLIFKNDSAASIFKLSSAKITLSFISLILGICPSKVIFSLASISSLFFILLSNICLKNIIIKPNINPPTKPNSVKRIKLGFSTSSG
ncbi:MAG: hypothetical protein MR932_04455, partial [Treponema porcinum]|nr:hypothetical protein [Treponema porcinum]